MKRNQHRAPRARIEQFVDLALSEDRRRILAGLGKLEDITDVVLGTSREAPECRTVGGGQLWFGPTDLPKGDLIVRVYGSEKFGVKVFNRRFPRDRTAVMLSRTSGVWRILCAEDPRTAPRDAAPNRPPQATQAPANGEGGEPGKKKRRNRRGKGAPKDAATTAVPTTSQPVSDASAVPLPEKVEVGPNGAPSIGGVELQLGQTVVGGGTGPTAT